MPLSRGLAFVLLTVLWGATAGRDAVVGWRLDPLDRLADPGSALARLTDRELARARAAEESHGVGALAAALVAGPLDETLAWAIQTHAELLARGVGGPGLRTRLALLRLESGDPTGAVDEARGLALEDAVRSLAVAPGSLGAEEAAALGRAASPSPRGWLARRVAARLRGDPGTRAEEADRRALARALRVPWIEAGLLLAVALVVAARRARGLRAVPPPAGPPASDAAGRGLPLGEGLALFLAADALRSLTWALLYHLVARVPSASGLLSAGQGLAALPLLGLLAARGVAGGRRGDPLGLSPGGPRSWARIAWIAGVALALDRSVGTLLFQALWRAGGAGPWAEGIDEVLWSGEIPAVALRILDLALWAPLVEELAFRGLLFLSLRQRLGAPAAALASALVFAGLHFYSLPGFVSVLWSGLVWAWACHRARSLWAALLPHAAANLLYLVPELGSG